MFCVRVDSVTGGWSTVDSSTGSIAMIRCSTRRLTTGIWLRFLGLGSDYGESLQIAEYTTAALLRGLRGRLSRSSQLSLYWTA